MSEGEQDVHREVEVIPFSIHIVGRTFGAKLSSDPVLRIRIVVGLAFFHPQTVPT